MTVAEGEQLELLEEEGDWVLCRKTDGTKGVGFVPATYIEVRPSLSLPIAFPSRTC